MPKDPREIRTKDHRASQGLRKRGRAAQICSAALQSSLQQDLLDRLVKQGSLFHEMVESSLPLSGLSCLDQRDEVWYIFHSPHLQHLSHKQINF